MISWVNHLRRLCKSPHIVDKTPIVSVLLLEVANIGQLWRMWTEHSAAGQSLFSWVSVHVALWLWLNFYSVFNPSNRWAIRGTQLGLLLNGAVILSVIYWRWL